MSRYSYTITLHPYGTEPNRGIVQIDPTAQYGYWEHRDGTEGGGLWFQPGDGNLELIDFDGDYDLPRPVVAALREHGFLLGPEYV